MIVILAGTQLIWSKPLPHGGLVTPSSLHIPGLTILKVSNKLNEIQIDALAQSRFGHCSGCHEKSAKIHSVYVRQLQDLSWFGCHVRWIIRLRKFFLPEYTLFQEDLL